MSIRDARPKSKSKEHGIIGPIRANKVGTTSSPMYMVNKTKMRSQDIEKGSSGVNQDSCFVKMLALISTLLLIVVAAVVLAMFFNARPFGSVSEFLEVPRSSKVPDYKLGLVRTSSDRPTATVIQAAMEKAFAEYREMNDLHQSESK